MVTSIRINAGGGAIGIYGADAYYSGGQTASSNSLVDGRGVYYPANQEVYQSERYGTFTYTFSDLTPDTIHTVKLHFNEHFWNSIGKRKFNVAINGTQVLWDYDIFSQSGGINKAIAEEFVVTSDARGQIVVDFTPGAADQPSVRGFEINQGTPPHNNMLLGCFPGYANIHDIESWLGKQHAVQVMFTSWDPNNKEDTFTRMKNIWDSGNVPVVTWEVFTDDRNRYAPANIDALIASGSYDSYLNDWADSMKNFLAGPGGVYGDADDRRVYLRFAHEMNGDWYPWSASYKNSQNTPTDYINMWRHVWTVFKNKGIDSNHLQWMWVPMNTDVGTPLHKAESYWPGDNYVDWVGIDAYNWGTGESWSNWTPPVALLDDMINRLSGYGKPLSIPEYGTTSVSYGSNNVGAKGQWIVEMFDYLSIKPQIKMLCYFNIDKETDWAIFGGGRGDSTHTIGSTVYQVYSTYKARVGAEYIISGSTNPQRITDAQFKGL